MKTQSIYAGIGLAVALVVGYMAHAKPSHEWQQIDPAEAGFAPDVAEKLDQAAKTKEFTNLHGVLVARNGKLLLERYYEGMDRRRGGRYRMVKFGPDVQHDIKSVTKSIVGLLYGIALAEGKVPAIDQPLLDQFPSYRDLADEPMRKRMTVFHALTMTMGTAWNESLPYSDPRNSEIAMDNAADRHRYVLDRPMLTEPGSMWTYSGGATAILARLVEQGTGRLLADYARDKLFAPLGFGEWQWAKDDHGEFVAASGLRMRPRDLAKIGQLILNNGTWRGTQVVPANWLQQSFTPRIGTGRWAEYGYHWWLDKIQAPGGRLIAAVGNGGQRLIVFPDWQLVVVITGGNYNKPEQWKVPIAVLRKVILPAFRDR